MFVRYWTYERCKEEALKYQTSYEFKKAEPSAYRACVKHRWLKDISSHFKSVYKPSGYWTVDKCIAEAKKYSSRESLRKNASRAYLVLWERKLLDDACSHMFKSEDYSYLRYSYAIEFPTENKVYVGITYKLAERKRKHLLMVNGKSSHKNGNIRDLLNRSIEYVWKPNSTAFHLNESTTKEEELYSYYEGKGWILLNISKLGSTGAKPRKTKHECHIDALKFKTRAKFSKYSSSSYGIARKHGWLDDICSHMDIIKKPYGYWSLEKCTELAKPYKTRMSFGKNEPYAYSSAQRNKWLDQVCAHMEITAKPDGYWTLEKCIEVAKKYEFKNEFRKNESSAYAIIKRNKWLDEACGHLKGVMTPHGHWNSYDNCKQEALKYKTRTEYLKKARGAYAKASKNGWLSDFFVK